MQHIQNKKISIFAGNNIKIVLILALAIFLRILGVWHDYPYSFYPDEVHFVKRALAFGSLDFNPHWFHKPAFYMYLLFFEYGIFFLIGKLAGLWVTVSDFAVSYIRNPGPFYIIGRVTTVFFSLGSILVVYRLGERHFQKGVGIVAALLLTLSYGHVSASQDIKADTPAMFFTVLSLLLLLNYLNSNNIKDLILASALAGVGTATKYYPIVMLIPIILSAAMTGENFREDMKNAIIKILYKIVFVLASFYSMYFICAPYNFIDPLAYQATFKMFFMMTGKILEVFGAEKLTHPGIALAQKTGLFQGVIDYFKVLFLTNGTGSIIASISIIGVVFLFFRLNKKIFIFLLYPVFFTIISILTLPGYAESRHQLPLYPFLAVCGGAFVVFLIENKMFHEKIVLTIFALMLCIPLYKIVERGLDVSRPDTRNIAKTWIESNIPSNTKLLMDANGPQLIMNENSINIILKKALIADSTGQFTANYDTYLNYQLLAAEGLIAYDIDEIRFPWWQSSEGNPGVYHAISEYDIDMGNPLKPVGVMSFEFYKKNGYEYVIVSSKMYVKFLKEDTNKVNNFPSFSRFYKTLFNEGKLIKEFIPEQGKSRGPVIKIFKVR